MIRRGFTIKIDNLIKTSRPEVCQPRLLIPKFLQKPQLCVASTLQSHLDMTKDLRGDADDLLITTRQPYKPSTAQTIARWIKAFLAKCGISSSYKAHSTRHAVTSAALKKGVDINIIKTTAGWSKGSLTYAKFYNRPIVPSKENFPEAVKMQNSI